ncbi:MAG: hypothetical protein U9R79_15870 [Armatimonadota bacterium]|nr:hypothetical protein [Armatimonadota bacterium]
MRLRGTVAAVLTVALVTTAAAQEEAQGPTASELVRESQHLADEGDVDAAMGKLLQALEIDPEAPTVHAHMGYLHELEGNTLKALASYGRLLELRPDDEYGRSRITHLFFGEQFPRRLRLSLLQFSPVSFVTDQCRVRVGEGVDELNRRIANTNAVIFPEGMDGCSGPVEKEIPSASGQGVVGTARFNRVCYGFTATPEGEELHMTAMTHYPSALLSERGADYSALAGRLTHILLRVHCYSRSCWGLPQAVEDDVVRLWMCESGPTGAEQYEDDIFLYDVGRDRAPVEWLREIAHEWGHFSLPRMGRFTEPEPYANGVLGEALLLGLLAEEAGLVVGERWPSEKAQAAINGLWGSGEVELASYLTDMRERTLDLWLEEGPKSELAAGLGEEAFHYLVGAMLWVEAAHGHALLRSTLLAAPGESPADFYNGYRQALREAAGRGPITIDAGALNVSSSQLTETPVEGALRREDVQLGPGDRADYPVYLLDGPASVRVEPGLRDLRLKLYVDGIGPLPVEGGEPVSLGQREQDWHTLRLEAPEDCPPVTLRSIVIETGQPETPAPGL